jgi:hypothetical protein
MESSAMKVGIPAVAVGIRLVYVTDPWGTEIEITEGLVSTPPAP